MNYIFEAPHVYVQFLDAKIILNPGNNCNSSYIFGAFHVYEQFLDAKIILNPGNNCSSSYIFGAPHFYEQCSDAKKFMVNNVITTWGLVKDLKPELGFGTPRQMEA